MLYQVPGWPSLAYNNTDDHPFISHAEYESALHNFTKPGGCRDLIEQCRALGQEGDPDWNGNNATVNKVCVLATDYCAAYAMTGVLTSLDDVSTFSSHSYKGKSQAFPSSQTLEKRFPV